MRLGRWERGTEERNGGGAGRKEQLRFGGMRMKEENGMYRGLWGQLMVLGGIIIMGKPIHLHSALF